MRFMTAMKLFSPHFLSATPAPVEESISGILNIATELYTWIFDMWGNLISFIFSHQGLLIFLGVFFVALGMALFLRLWHKVRN